MKYLVKTREHLLSDGYAEDDDGDFWEKQEYADYYNDDSGIKPEGFNNAFYVHKHMLGRVALRLEEMCDVNLCEESCNAESVMWAIEKVLTPENDPEYFI